jgi:hypothetical protein
MSLSTAVPIQEPEWAAFVAIDWADRKNFWRLLPAGSQCSEQGELANTPEGVEEWAVRLQQRFGGRPVAVCLEQSRGALVYMLTKYPHLVLFPIHPTMSANYRKNLLAEWCQERSGRHRRIVGSLTAASGQTTLPAAGHGRDPTVASAGGGTPAASG